MEMVKKAFQFVLGAMVVIGFGVILNLLYEHDFYNFKEIMPWYAPWIIGIIFGLIFALVIAPASSNIIFKHIFSAEARLSKMSSKELIISIVGVVCGLIIANLLGSAFSSYGAIGTAIMIILYLVFGYLGYRVANSKKEDFNNLSAAFKPVASKKTIAGKPKILDTNVIIDGRILDLLKTGFIEGKIIIPNFVLEELRHIADSSDSLKRNRGRRGLDILNEIQKQLAVAVEIVDFTYKEPLEVDSLLLKMAEKIDAYVVTNDFNLNKVAEFQGVKVLNINELANAIKPVVLPGEEMSVTIIKEGKENGQGVAYLNDGTMIVVEGGHKHIGETRMVLVTSVLQTAAGRMIFTKMKD